MSLEMHHVKYKKSLTSDHFIFIPVPLFTARINYVIQLKVLLSVTE